MIPDKFLRSLTLALDGLIFFGSLVTLSFWATGEGLFYSDTEPVLSPFTSFSLLLMSGSRLSDRLFETWSKPMTMALLVIVIGGNLSSIMVQYLVPQLFLQSMPTVVPTSIMTSTGLILFSLYEMLVIFRKTPESAFIIDDLLLLMALLPGGISLLGHWLEHPYYISSDIDPRSGISIFEMAFMGNFAIVAVLSNKDLFLWKFLSASHLNKLVFTILTANQFAAPLIVAFMLDSRVRLRGEGPGIELFIMLAGVFATFIFLVIQAFIFHRKGSI